MARPPLPTLTPPSASPSLVATEDPSLPTSTPTSAPPSAAGSNGEKEKKEENPHLLKLGKPLLVGERTLTELTLDCRNMTGADFRALATEFRMKYNAVTPNIIYDERFRLLVLGRLNGIPEEDFDGLSFSDILKASSRILYLFTE
jgi:hypothetical protein